MQELNMLEIDEVSGGLEAKNVAIGLGCIIVGCVAFALAPAIAGVAAGSAVCVAVGGFVAVN